MEEDESLKREELAEKLKATKKRENEEGEVQRKNGEEEIGIEEDEEIEEAEHGKRKVKKVHDPKLPTEEEVKEHYLSGHMPYRSWCHHCVGGRGRERDHTKRATRSSRASPNTTWTTASQATSSTRG